MKSDNTPGNEKIIMGVTPEAFPQPVPMYKKVFDLMDEMIPRMAAGPASTIEHETMIKVKGKWYRGIMKFEVRPCKQPKK